MILLGSNQLSTIKWGRLLNSWRGFLTITHIVSNKPWLHFLWCQNRETRKKIVYPKVARDELNLSMKISASIKISLEHTSILQDEEILSIHLIFQHVSKHMYFINKILYIFNYFCRVYIERNLCTIWINIIWWNHYQFLVCP